LSATELDVAPGSARAARAGRLTQALLSTPFLGTVIAIFSWPLAWIGPTTGPDPSWAAGLYMAHEQGLQFGREFVFTYGPLGFLEVPVLYDETLWMLAFAYRGLLYVALAVSLFWAARRAFPLPVAVAGCYTLLVLGNVEEAVLLVALVWCLAALSDRPPRFAAPLIVFGGGAIGAIELLGKANFGIGVLALCAAALLGLPERRRNVPRFAAVALTALAALWLLSGQALANAPAFAANTLRVIGGYSQAMTANLNDLTWQRPAAASAIVLLLAAAWLAARRDPLPRRLSTLGLVAIFSFLCFKQGFVRQGWGSEFRFFAVMLGAGIALAWRLPTRLPKLPPHLPALVLTAPLMAFTVAALPRPSFWESLEPRDHIDYLRQDLHAFLSPGERERFSSESRRSMRFLYRLDPQTRRIVGRHPVDIAPWEIGVAWAYGLNWRPLPVIQSYTAYTPKLDQLNAAALGGAAAPRLILRQNTAGSAEPKGNSIDGRYLAWDPPAATLAMLCGYRAVHTTEHWQVLTRAQNRCGPPRPLKTVVSETGREVAIPPPPTPHEIVFARIYGVGVGGWESLRSMLYRARERTVTLDGGITWRLVAATAADGLIMRAPAAVDFPKPFRLAPDARTMSVRIEGAPPRGIQVKFFAQPVRLGGPGSTSHRGHRNRAEHRAPPGHATGFQVTRKQNRSERGGDEPDQGGEAGDIGG
jgi:hypothetical protein